MYFLSSSWVADGMGPLPAVVVLAWEAGVSPKVMEIAGKLFALSLLFGGALLLLADWGAGQAIQSGIVLQRVATDARPAGFFECERLERDSRGPHTSSIKIGCQICDPDENREQESCN